MKLIYSLNVKTNMLSLNLRKTVCKAFFVPQDRAQTVSIGEIKILNVYTIKNVADYKKYSNNMYKKDIYYAHIYSHISYAIPIWGSMLSHTMTEKLFKLQKECVRLITN